MSAVYFIATGAQGGDKLRSLVASRTQRFRGGRVESPAPQFNRCADTVTVRTCLSFREHYSLMTESWANDCKMTIALLHDDSLSVVHTFMVLR